MSSTYKSPRLQLTSLAEEDSAFIFELLNTVGWKTFIGDRNVNSIKEAGLYIERINSTPNCFYKVVKLKTNATPIGIITHLKRDYLPYADIGFAFLPQYANNGYAFESASAVLSGLEKDSASSFILATTIASNINSIRLLKKLGFQFKEDIKVANEVLQVFELSISKLSINKLTQLFYSSFTNTNKRIPTLASLYDICLPEAQLIRTIGGKQLVYNLPNFISPREKILQDGTLTEFEEKEVSDETKIFRNIAQRCSRYEKSGIINKITFKENGNKLFQFIKTAQGWKISGLVWEDETNP